MARPCKEVDWELLEELCELQCTAKECAAALGMCPGTLTKKLQAQGYTGFSDYFDEKRTPGLTSLRRKQYEKAMEGDKTMLVWLGKQYLGQTDHKQISQTTEILGEANITYSVAEPPDEEQDE